MGVRLQTIPESETSPIFEGNFILI